MIAEHVVLASGGLLVTPGPPRPPRAGLCVFFFPPFRGDPFFSNRARRCPSCKRGLLSVFAIFAGPLSFFFLLFLIPGGAAFFCRPTVAPRHCSQNLVGQLTRVLDCACSVPVFLLGRVSLSFSLRSSGTSSSLSRSRSMRFWLRSNLCTVCRAVQLAAQRSLCASFGQTAACLSPHSAQRLWASPLACSVSSFSQPILRILNAGPHV